MTTPSNGSSPPAVGGNSTTAPAAGVLNNVAGVVTSQISSTGTSVNAVGPNINALLQPPSLKTFVYSPNVRIVIGHGTTEFDVSADMVRCQLVRPENSAATFTFTLHNKGLRYTPPGMAPLFSRMDRIVVYMSKTSWIQVFAGYLDTVPYKQLYPGSVNFKATCTIKRLMNTQWDPALGPSLDLISSFNTAQAELGVDGATSSIQTGLGSLLQALLTRVGGWNITNIHIQNFPVNFLNYLTTQISQYTNAGATGVQNLDTSILGSTSTAAPGAAAGSNPNAGTPGPYAPSGTGLTGVGTAFYVSQIVAACDNLGMGPLVSDNNLGASLLQSGATGEASGGPFQNPGQQKAWQEVQQTGQTIQSDNRNSDAAIIGVACSMVETGPGVIRNLYNPSVPESQNYPNDGPGTNGSCLGIFQLQDSWGNAGQRMNPQQSATLFFNKLNALNWRNMDPGQAAQQALGSSTSASDLYDAQISSATDLVQAYRTTLTGSAASVANAGIPGTSVAGTAASDLSSGASGLGSAPSSVSSLLPTGATTVPAPASIAGAANPITTVKPQPDSEGAINFALTCIGLPYVWGATGPASYDCSGLVTTAFKAIGVNLGRTTQDIASYGQRVPSASVLRGDCVEPSSGHVVIWMGDGTIIEAAEEGVPIHQVTNPYGPPTSWYGVFRACQNGGVDPTAAYNPPATMGPGTTPGALDQTGGATSSGSTGSTDGSTVNLFNAMFQPQQFVSQTAQNFTGEKAFLESQPLLHMVAAVAGATLCNWSSAPNGDFMAWYPDYWGLDGKPAVFALADIELKDVTINFSDDPMATHVYVNGDFTYGLDLTADNELAGWMMTAGVATVEDTWLWARLLAASPADLDSGMSGQQVMQKFGVRPLKQTYSMAGDQSLELLLACQIFMQKWAEQYQTDISMTFMPELFPGMRVQLIGHNLQVYVSAVTHLCDYEQGFTTQATIIAPSNPNTRALMQSVNTVGVGPTATDQIALTPAAQAIAGLTNTTGGGGTS